MTTTPRTVGVALVDAARYIERHGWHQGDLYDAHDGCTRGCVCHRSGCYPASLIGAVRAALVGQAKWYMQTTPPGIAEAYTACLAHLDQHLTTVGAAGLQAPLDVWQDTPGRTAAQATAALRAAAFTAPITRFAAPTVAEALDPETPPATVPAPAYVQQEMSTMELRADPQGLLRNALAAAERGWHVFPCRPNDKPPAFPDHDAEHCRGRDPRCRAAGHHVQWQERATRDPDRIRRAWSAAPYNIGIACGPSGLVVVDLDTPKPGKTTRPDEWAIEGVNDGGDVFVEVSDRAGQPVPLDTYTVRTGRGGSHLYYLHPTSGPQLRNTTSGTPGALGWLIDTRAHGGYVLGAGSVVNGRPYGCTWDVPPVPLPDWLTERLTPAPLPEQRPVVVELAPDRRGGYLRAAIDAELRHIAEASTSDHLNRSVYGAAVALGQLVAGGALADADAETLLLNAATAAGHPAGPARRTIRSGFRAGAGRPRSVAA